MLSFSYSHSFIKVHGNMIIVLLEVNFKIEI